MKRIFGMRDRRNKHVIFGSFESYISILKLIRRINVNIMDKYNILHDI